MSNPAIDTIAIPAAALQRARPFYGWRLAAALWGILFVNLAFPMYGAGVMTSYMGEALHLDRKTLGLAFAVYMTMAGLPGPLAALCINRFGARITMAAGSGLVACGAAAMASVVHTGLGVTLAFGVVVGLGVCMGGVLGAQTVVAEWFARRRALALAVVLSANGFGGFVAPPLLDRVISLTGDWRAGWWVLAALSVLTALIALIFVRGRPSELGQDIDGRPAATPPAAGFGAAVSAHEWTMAGALRTQAFWVLAFGACAYTGGLSLVFAHGVAQLRVLGNSPAQAAFAMALVAVASLIGKTIVGALGDRVPSRISWAVALVFAAGGLLASTVAVGLPSLYLFAILYGLGLGAGLVAMTALTADFFGRRPFASIAGFLLFVQTLISASGPVVAGILFDRTGSYAPAFAFLAAACVLAAALLVLTRPPTPPALAPI